MKMAMTLLAMVIWTALAVATPTPGVQVVGCYEDPPDSDIWVFDYFTCTGDFSANDLHIILTPEEIAEGAIIMGCSVPDLPGYDCGYSETEAWYTFPTVGPFDCVPGQSDQYLDIVIYTEDQFTAVFEVWTLDNDEVGEFVTVIACPVTPAEQSTWGSLKALYR